MIILKCENDHFIKYTNNNYTLNKTKKGHRNPVLLLIK
jgi:hypothetical protein